MILCLAALLRFGPVSSGLPYSNYIDEGFVLHQVIHVLKQRTLDPGWHGYPSLPAYLTATAVIATSPIYRKIHRHSVLADLPSEAGRTDLPVPYHYDLITPAELLLIGRLLAALLSLATVLLTGMIATRLAGTKAGLVAGLLAALCPALVLRGSTVMVDTFAAFFVVLAFYACERIGPEHKISWQTATLAGVSAGLAFACKYTAAAFFVAVFILILARSSNRATLVRCVAAAACGMLAGVLVGAPSTVFNAAAVIQQVAGTYAGYGTNHSDSGYFGQAVSRIELGWPLSLAAGAGLLILLRQPGTRWTAISWCVAGGISLCVLLRLPFQPFRNLLPFVPLICISAAIALVKATEWTRRSPLVWLRSAVLVLLVSIVTALPAIAGWTAIQRRIAHRDSRIEAIDWLQEHTTKEQSVLGIRELAILPPEWKRVNARITLVSLAEATALLDREKFDYVVTGDFDARFTPDAEAGAGKIAKWRERTAPFSVATQFGSGPAFVAPYLWHTNDELVRVLKVD